MASGLCAGLWSPIGFDSLFSLRLLPGLESFAFLAAQAAASILRFPHEVPAGVWDVAGGVASEAFCLFL